MRRTPLLLTALGAVLTTSAVEFTEIHDIPYTTTDAPYAQNRCRLDLVLPKGVTNFATIVNFHGGGLVSGRRSICPWPKNVIRRDPVAHVAVGYRLLTNATPAECVGDAAAAAAWTLRHIAEYGGDPKKVFLTGVSGGGYLTALVGMDPKWLAPHGFAPTNLAGIIPLTGQMTKHFNIRSVGFRDADAQFLPKIDEWAPLHHVKQKGLPPCCFLTGGRDVEWKARVEENDLLAASLRALGVTPVEFHETEGDHGGGITPSSLFLRDFVMKTVDAGGVGRFAPNERIAFFGDSITHDSRFVCYLQLFAVLRHPGWNIRCLNAGISGDTTTGALGRWSYDVLKMKPDRVFSMFGMNDIDRESWKTAEPNEEARHRRQAALERYAKRTAELVDLIGTSGVKHVLVTPSPYDQYSTVSKNVNALCNEPGLARCAETVRTTAARRTLGLVDLHKPLTDLLRTHPERTLCGGDRVHPRNEGHLLMAAIILETMGEDPLVSCVSIDAKKSRIGRVADGQTRNARVSALTVDPKGVRFTYAPKALPFPSLPEYLADDEIHPLTQNLNREIFVITGLAPGRYAIAFDDVKVGSFSAEALSKGVNVALLSTPNQLRAREAATLAAELKKRTEDLRHCVCLLGRPRRAGIDLKNIPAVVNNIEPWILEMERLKQPWIPWSRKAFEQCRACNWNLSVFEAEIDDLYERLNAVRPAISRVSVLVEQ